MEFLGHVCFVISQLRLKKRVQKRDENVFKRLDHALFRARLFFSFCQIQRTLDLPLPLKLLNLKTGLIHI